MKVCAEAPRREVCESPAVAHDPSDGLWSLYANRFSSREGDGFGHFSEIIPQEILGLETEKIKDSGAWSPGSMDNACFCLVGHTLWDLS